MRTKKFMRNTLLSVVTWLSLFALSARAEDIKYDKFGGWSIVYVDVVSSNSCSAFITFPDQTVMQIALVQTKSELAWAMFLSNAKWNSIFAGRSQVTLSLLTSKSWSSTFSITTNKAGDKPVLVSTVSTTLVRSI